MNFENFYDLELKLVHPRAHELYEYNLLNRSPDNAGFDLYCMDYAEVKDECCMLFLGVAARLVRNTGEEVHFQLVPRSSIYKKGLVMANSVGIIDRSYRGELKAPVWSMTRNSEVFKGERLFQIVAPDMGHIKNVRIVDSLPATQRGTGGFGSTGQ